MPILTILQSTAPRESRRIDLTVTRGIFLIAAFLVLLPAQQLQRNMAPTGPILHGLILGMSLLLMVFLAVRLGADSVGAVRSEFLEFLFLTGIQPHQWLIIRLTQLWIAFVSVWVIRAPLLVFIFTMGGIRLEKMILMELLLLTGFLLLSSLALLTSVKAKSSHQVYGLVIVSIIALESLLLAPGITIGLISRYYQWTVPLQTYKVTEAIAEIGMVSRCQFVLFNPATLIDLWPTLLLYIALAGAALARFGQLMLAVSHGTIAQTLEPPNRPQRKRRTQHASRRCWDDALAWQAYSLHGLGRRLVIVKCVAFCFLGMALLFSKQTDYALLVFILVTTTCGVAMLVSTSKPSDCLPREIRDRTLPILLLTPHETDDFVMGWQRGAWRLAWPEIGLGAVITLASLGLDLLAPPIVLGGAGMILFSGPFFMLSPLVPFTPAGIATGLALFFVLFVFSVICIALGATAHPIAGVLLLIPLAFLFNYTIRRKILPFWMRRKISSVV